MEENIIQHANIYLNSSGKNLHIQSKENNFYFINRGKWPEPDPLAFPKDLNTQRQTHTHTHTEILAHAHAHTYMVETPV